MSSEVSIRTSTSLPAVLRLSQPSKAPVGLSQKLRIQSDKSTVRTKSNQLFRFTIPNASSLWDGRNSRVCFDMVVEPGTDYDSITAAKWSIHPNIGSIFSRLRILAGTTEIVNIENYNLLYNMLMETGASAEWNNTVGDILMNTGILTERQKYIKPSGATVAPIRRFCMPLLGTDLLNNTLPLFVNAPYIIELTVAPMSQWLEWAGTGTEPTPTQLAEIADFRLENINFHTQVLSLSTELEAQMRSEFANQVRSYAFTSWDHYSIQSAGSSHQLQIPTKKSNIDGFMAVMRDASDASLYAQENRLSKKYLFNGLVSTQFRINGQNIPQDPIENINGNAEGMYNLLELLGKQNSTISSMNIKENDWTVAAADESYTKAMSTIISANLKKFPSTGLISGYNTSQAVGSFLLKLQTDNVLATHPDNQFDCYTRFAGLLQVSNGRVSVVN